MATRFSNTLLPQNATDADFRAWVQFVEDVLVTTGLWVVTADTGQMVIATAVKPGATTTKVGYRIYRMDDALQATSPVFMRIDYGSSSNTNFAGMWITIGTGSNGAGTITNIRYNGGINASPDVANGGTASSGTHNSYGSAAANRVVIALFVQSTASRILLFSIERSKDSTGADTGDGLLLSWVPTGTTLAFSKYMLLGAGGQPAAEAGIQYILSAANPSAYGSDVGIGLVIHLKGIAQFPGTQLAVVRANDFAPESQFAMSLYGANRTYQHLYALNAALGQNLGSSDSTARICMRYD